MGNIIQHETITVDRIPAWIQRLIENKKKRTAEMQRKCDELYQSNMLKKQLDAQKTSC